MALVPTYKTMFKFNKNIIKYNWKSINEGPLKRAGLLARKIEMGLIRRDHTKSQRPSKPGRPPKSRHPSDIFRRIYSVPHPLETNVIIGHVGLYGGQTAMEIHEFGQPVTIKEKIIEQKYFTIHDPIHRAKVRQKFLSGKIKSKPRRTRSRTIQMPKRPFAAPTLQRVQKRLPALWANSVSSATVRNT